MRHARRILVALAAAALAASVVFACVGEDPDTVIVINNDAAADGEPPREDSSTTSDGGSDAANDVVKTGCPDPNTPATIAFTTSVEINPDFGGLPGADLKCAEAAADGGLAGTYRAWVSSDGTSAAARIVEPDPTRPIRLVGDAGPIIVACAAKLVEGSLAHAIDRNQRVEPVSQDRQVWTGTFADGGLFPDAGCKNWTSGMGGVFGAIGDPHSLSSAWTHAGVKDCGGNARIMCFQVP